MKQTKKKLNEKEMTTTTSPTKKKNKKKKLSVDSSWSYKPGVFIVFYGTKRFLATFSDDIFFFLSHSLFSFLPIVIGDPLLQTGMIIKRERERETSEWVAVTFQFGLFVRLELVWQSIIVDVFPAAAAAAFLFELYIFV